MDIKVVNNIDPEYLPLCPYCDQPIMFEAVVIRHEETNQLALACADCATARE